MNLPEHRRAQRIAYSEYREAVEAAAEKLMKELAVADEQFFEDQDEEKAVDVDEYVIAKRQR